VLLLAQVVQDATTGRRTTFKVAMIECESLVTVTRDRAAKPSERQTWQSSRMYTIGSSCVSIPRRRKTRVFSVAGEARSVTSLSVLQCDDLLQRGLMGGPQSIVQRLQPYSRSHGFVWEDMARMPEITGSELARAVPAHQTRLWELMDTHQKLMQGQPPPL
jgi:hypothetical protein